MSLCGTCGHRIIWCRTELGKRMPVDAEPSPDGNLVLTGSDLLPTAKSVGRDGNPRNKPLYKSHFATCRDAEKHRKAKAASNGHNGARSNGHKRKRPQSGGPDLFGS